MPKSPSRRFSETLTIALEEFAKYGYDSRSRLDYWMSRLREAAMASLKSPEQIDEDVRVALKQVSRRVIRKSPRYHRGLGRYAIQRVGNRLAPELERRIMASVDLIRLHRQEAIEKTLQRFSGLATSLPPGTRTLDKREARTQISKSLRQMNFEARRVVIDQGHKLINAVNSVIAEDNGAIAAVWHSHWRQPGYDYRPDHKERDEQIYAVRGNWAITDGLMKPGHYLDEITQPGQEVFCRCYVSYLYHLRDLPDDRLTKKGRQSLNPPEA